MELGPNDWRKIVDSFCTEPRPDARYSIDKPWTLPDGRPCATNGKAAIVLNKGIIDVDAAKGKVPLMMTLLKDIPGQQGSLPLPNLIPPALYQRSICERCVGGEKYEKDEALCLVCGGKGVLYEESAESVMTLVDKKRECRFARGLIHLLDNVGRVTYKLPAKTGELWIAWFWFPHGVAMIVPQSQEHPQ